MATSQIKNRRSKIKNYFSRRAQREPFLFSQRAQRIISRGERGVKQFSFFSQRAQRDTFRCGRCVNSFS